MPINMDATDVRRKSAEATAAAAAAAEIIPDILRVDFIDGVAQRKLSSDSLKGDRNLQGIQPGEFNQAMEIMDRYCEESGYESPSRRILKTLSRISPVVESHGLMKKNREFEKKWKIEGNVQEQKDIQINQGTTQLVGGAAALLFKLLGAVPQWGGILSSLGDVPHYVVNTVDKYFDAKRTPKSHEQSFFLNTTQAERQAIESLKQLPESLRNLALELMRLKVREAENIFQR